jgi:Putative adhesin
MPSWTVDGPTSLDFDEVTALNVHLAGGTVAVLATDDRPSLAVTELGGRPLRVSHVAGKLTVGYEKPSLDGLFGLDKPAADDLFGAELPSLDKLLGFLKPRRGTAAVTITVPVGCPVELDVSSASAIVSGLSAAVSVKSLSGAITLDGLAGDVTAETMSGEVAACDIDGEIRLRSMSGRLTLAGGKLSSLEANSMSGQVTADVTLAPAGSLRINTMSGAVTLRLPTDSDAQVRLHSTSGAIRSEFDSLRTTKAAASHAASGNVGAGTGQVSVTTGSGALTLLRRTPAEMESKTR